ncbi:M55 family metallopeptidase [Propionivibrio sp.]|uniref:M55 family metallopeptidase n=1 Tax=Propionivibrio sp. TaxID=2212460 RepID=UPI0039E56860
MRILISTDIEGVAGVVHPEQTRAGNAEYERARRWMTREANAAICGAFDGGATEVRVNDSHGTYRNLLADELDPRARLVNGKPRTLGMMGGLEADCAGVMLVGFHARAQARGVLAHTINSSAFARVWLNGQEFGEAGLYGALAGEMGVPVVFASGDDVFAEETRPLFPHCVFAVTKQAAGRHSAVSLSPQATCEAIRAGARQAMAVLGAAAPLRLELPVCARLQAQTPAHADLFCQWPALERVDGVTLEFSAASVEHAVRMLNCLSAMAAALN